MANEFVETPLNLKQVVRWGVGRPDDLRPASPLSSMAEKDKNVLLNAVVAEPKITFHAIDVQEGRVKLHDSVTSKGKVLSDDHEFTLLVKEVSEKLGVPEDAEFLVLDTEEVDAFYHPKAKVVGFSRGFGRFLLEQGLPLTEDHLAAVLAHEIEHAAALGDDYVNKLQSGFRNRLIAMQSHAEEYWADAESLKRLSKAGYNPKAAIEVQRSLSLTHGRYDIGHPEQIDRIRKLEDQLADDEHPLSHTNKEFTPLNPDLLSWFAADSTVYAQTELSLHQSPEELQKAVLETTSHEDFWHVYDIQQHTERVANGKAFVAKHDDEVSRAVTKMIVYEALNQADVFVDGKPVHRDLDSYEQFRNEKKQLSDNQSTQIYSVAFPTNLSGFEKVGKSADFRDGVVAKLLSQDISDQARRELSAVEQNIDKVLGTFFDHVDTSKMSPEVRQWIIQAKRCYESGNITEDIFLTAYSGMDETHQRSLHDQSVAESKTRGLRAPEIKSGLLNVRNRAVRDRLLEQMKLGVATSVIVLPEPSQTVVTHLGSLIAKDTAMPVDGAEIIAQTMLLGKDGHPWANYLKSLDKSTLRNIIYSVQKLTDGYGTMMLSPLRDLHQSYRLSKEAVVIPMRPMYASGGDFGLDAGGLQVLRMLPARELYLKGYPPGYELGFHNKLPVSEVKLTLDEWNAVVEGQATHGVWFERDIWVMQQYIKGLKSGQPVDQALLEQTKKIVYFSTTEGLNAEELELLLDHSPWEPQDLVKKIEPGINHLPHAAATIEERDQIVKSLRKSYDLFTAHPPERVGIDAQYYHLTREAISSHMLDVLVQDAEVKGMSIDEALTSTIKRLTEENVTLSYTSFSKEAIAHFGSLPDEGLTDIVSYLKNRPSLDDSQIKLLESLKILSEVPSADRPKVAPKVFCEIAVQSIMKNHSEAAVDWVSDNIHTPYTRDALLVALVDYAPQELKLVYLDRARDKFSAYSPDRYGAKKSAAFPFELYFWSSRERQAWEPGEQTDLGIFHGEGKLAEKFPDILARRHPFSTISASSQDLFKDRRRGVDDGSPYQRLYAQQLISAETVMFDPKKPLTERVGHLQEVVPLPSVVKDIHLELLFQEELGWAKSPEEQLGIGKTLFPLFTEKSTLKAPIGVQILRSEIAVNPAVLNDYDGFLQLVNTYLPESSLAKNYFLSKLENSASLTPEQLRALIKMRMSSEGKKSETDDAPMTFVFNRLGELNREERIKTSVWLLGLSEEKPIAVLNIEKKFDGHLNNLPKAVALSTDDEREVLFKRLFLGAEGIVDLEAVPANLRAAAEQQRKVFLETLSSYLLPDSMPNSKLFRTLFITTIEESDPSHASQTLTRLINKLSEAQLTGNVFSPEEVIALGLTEQGVVGKKVAQSLAELEWIPESYKQTLKQAQSEGTIVTKRALLTFAEDAGLLSEDSPVTIVSFDQLIGSASNKQACLLTIDVHDKTVGLPVGKHQVVGKFKRPSAQKTENLNHDLMVLGKILNVLQKEGHAAVLPKDFSTQISNAVRRELDFAKEKQFSDEVRNDIIGRNKKRKTQVKIPTILFASDDVMIETRADGMSLRSFYDLKEDTRSPLILIREGYGALKEKAIDQAILSEGLAELIATGNIHADLHPGNIFVDKQGDVTFIDLGMHERLTKDQRFNTISLLTGLILGNEPFVKTALRNLGWNVETTKINFKPTNFSQNSLELLNAMRKADVAPPESVAAIVFAASKLTTYTKNVNYKDLFTFLLRVMDKREVPRIIAHVVKTGRKELLQ